MLGNTVHWNKFQSSECPPPPPHPAPPEQKVTIVEQHIWGPDCTQGPDPFI